MYGNKGMGFRVCDLDNGVKVTARTKQANSIPRTVPTFYSSPQLVQYLAHKLPSEVGDKSRYGRVWMSHIRIRQFVLSYNL